jgi:cysteine desulfurase
MIYLDYNATAPVKPAVRAAMLEAMERHGNPSSVHRYGRIARRYIQDARAAVAAFVGVKPAQVVFTGSGTEANNMVFHGLAGTHFITSSIEHDSILACTPAAQRIPVSCHGVVDLTAMEEIVRDAPKGSLVSVMLVNNETGVIQPLAEIGRIVRSYGHTVHVDAVQAAGRLPIDFTVLGADFLTLSAHKIGGPQGIGALVINENIALESLVKGGGQEMNRRAGTENVPAIIGFGLATQLAADDLRDVPRLSKWRDRLQSQIQKFASEHGYDDIVILGEHAPRVANTLCVAMRNVSHDTQVMAMDLAGIAVSAGAACSSGKINKVSHVLNAMGYANDVAGAALRISLGWNSKAIEIDNFLDAWRPFYRRIHSNEQSEAA